MTIDHSRRRIRRHWQTTLLAFLMAIVVAPSTGRSECGGHVDSELQDRLERQRSKTTRVRVPTWEEVKQNLPPGDATNSRRPTRGI